MASALNRASLRLFVGGLPPLPPTISVPFWEFVVLTNASFKITARWWPPTLTVLFNKEVEWNLNATMNGLFKSCKLHFVRQALWPTLVCLTHLWFIWMLAMLQLVRQVPKGRVWPVKLTELRLPQVSFCWNNLSHPRAWDDGNGLCFYALVTLLNGQLYVCLHGFQLP